MGTLIIFDPRKQGEFASDIEALLPAAQGTANSIDRRLTAAQLVATRYEFVIRTWLERLQIEANIILPLFDLAYVPDPVDRVELGLITNHAFALVQCDINRVHSTIESSSQAVFLKPPSRLSRQAQVSVAHSLMNETKYTLVAVKSELRDKSSVFADLFGSVRERDDGDGLC